MISVQHIGVFEASIYQQQEYGEQQNIKGKWLYANWEVNAVNVKYKINHTDLAIKCDKCASYE